MDLQNHKTETICKVCGDKASGKHYGVASCDGCRGFFKRSIRRNLEYVCKENGRCVVDVTRRNQCQACRFKKCLHVNMKRDAVQHERAPRTPTQSIHHHYPFGLVPRFRGTLHPHQQHQHSTSSSPSSSIFSSLPLTFTTSTSNLLDHTMATVPHPIIHAGGEGGGYLHHSLIYPTLFSGLMKNNGVICSGLTASSGSRQYIEKAQNLLKQNDIPKKDVLKEDEVTSSEEVSKEKSDVSETSTSITDSNRIELPILNETDEKKSTNFLHLQSPCLSVFSENIYESAAKLLFLSIKWARSIPSFLQLAYRDQTILLEESWNELFILTASQWCFPVDEVFLLNNTTSLSSRTALLEEDARKLREIISRLNILRVDHTEHACLKALVLFKSECRGLCEPTRIELLQDQTHVMLHEYCSQRQVTAIHHHHNKGRFGKLLLTLPLVQSISKRSLEELLFKQTVGDVAIDKLLVDLAKISYSN